MSTVFEDNTSSLKLKKLNLYWTKYSFLRKRIHKDILFLYVDFENMELINFLIETSFDKKNSTGNLLTLIKIVEKFDENISETFTRGHWFFNKKKRTVSNETILEDVNKLYNSIAFQFTRKDY